AASAAARSAKPKDDSSRAKSSRTGRKPSNSSRSRSPNASSPTSNNPEALPAYTHNLTSSPRDPEAKGLVERTNGYFETSFLPGRTFTCVADFNTQLTEWLSRVKLLAGSGSRESWGSAGRPGP